MRKSAVEKESDKDHIVHNRRKYKQKSKLKNDFAMQ